MSNWDNVEVSIGGRKLEGISSISYEPQEEDFKTIVFESQGQSKMKSLPAMEFYLKRKNKYYFRNKNGAKYVIETNDNPPFKKGDKFNMQF